MSEIIQDGSRFIQIPDDDESMFLQQAAEGEIVLFAALKPHSAKLIAHGSVSTPKTGKRTRAACLVPMLPKFAQELLLFPQATLTAYPAVHPDEADLHPWEDHYFRIDTPQEISRKNVYYESAAIISANRADEEVSEKNKQHEKPWFISCINDPEPEQPWYIPARYIARSLVKKDSTLLVKSNLLSKKVSDSLKNVGIYKRGGKKPFNPDTIKKALSNISLG